MISILMPAKNAGRYIESCLQSILKQSVSDWELIVVDDHSADDTPRIVSSYAKKDPRIRLFHHSQKGILPALRFAQRQASGKYITRMDADDLMPMDKLKYFIDYISLSPSKSIVTGKVRYFSDQAVSPGYLAYQNWLNRVVDQGTFFDEIYRECTIASPNWMVRKDDFIAMGGFDALDYPEDVDMVFQLRKHRFQVIGVDAVTHLWREHPDRASRNLPAYQQASFFRLKTHYFLQSEPVSRSTLMLWGAGKKGKLIARLLLERNQDFVWLDWQAEKYRGRIYDQPVLSFEYFSEFSDPLVINSVSPPDTEQRRIDRFLVENDLRLGVNYFVF